MIRGLIMAFAVSLALLLAEALVRLVAPQGLIINRPDVWYGTDGIGWDRAPNLDVLVNFAGAGSVRLITDDQGNRIGREGQVRDPEIRILAIGDSFVEALQVEYEQTMTWLLQEGIRQRTGKRTVVECAGVGGWSPNQYLLRSTARLPRAEYDLQVVFLYLGNDIEPRRVASLPRRHPHPVHLVRFPRRLTRYEIIDALLYPANDWLETHSQAFVLLRNRLKPFLARFGLTALELPLIVQKAVAQRDCWDVTIGILREIQANGRAHGVPTLFVLIPPDYMFANLPLKELGFDPSLMDLAQPYKIMSEKMNMAGFRIVDLVPAFRATPGQGRDCYGKVDTHLSAEGHRLAATVFLPDVIEALGSARTEDGAAGAASPTAQQPLR